MEKTKVVFCWSGINSKTLKKTRSLTPQHVRETKRLQILTHYGRPLKNRGSIWSVWWQDCMHESHPSTGQLFSLLYIDRQISLFQMDRYRSISIQIQISREISRSIIESERQISMDTPISGGSIYSIQHMYHSGPLGGFFPKQRRKKKKTEPHAGTHKNDPKRFSDDFATK